MNPQYILVSARLARIIRAFGQKARREREDQRRRSRSRSREEEERRRREEEERRRREEEEILHILECNWIQKIFLPLLEFRYPIYFVFR